MIGLELLAAGGLKMTQEKEIRMVDLKSQYVRLKPEIDTAMQAVIDATQFIKGPQVKKFEENLSQYLGVKHTISCANGTEL